MSFCLPKEFATKFINALKDGTINPAKLSDMTSIERRDFLATIVGKDDAREVNAQLESKLLLKDQQRGMVSWAKKISGITEATRTDIISKIERMSNVLEAKNEGAFLQDLATKKMGADITFEEAQHITDGVKATNGARAKIDPESPNGSPDRIDYGVKYVEFQKYVSQLKLKGSEDTWKEWISSPSKVFNTIAGTTKSILASFDNSFFGRQGVKMLYTKPTIWGNAFLKSWGDIAKEAAGVDAMDALKADIFSRKNALNGKYAAGNFDLGISSEEAFPSSLPEKIPILGRLYKGAEAAFNGAALRMRADYADKLIPAAERAGIDTTNPQQARGLGTIVNSMTGRGDLGKIGLIGKEVNNAFFSIKFLKSNFDTLTANRLGFAFEKGPMRTFARKQAAANILKIIAVQAAIMTTANLLSPGSAETDPRSSNFGKIKIGGNTIDTTGGMGSLVTLAARITPTMHDGVLGFWDKSSTSGKWTNLTAGAYGQQDAMDVINSFWEGKLSPIAGVARDVWTGKNYNNQKPTVGNEALSMVTPLPIQDFQQLQSPDSATTFGLMLLDALGFSTNGPSTPAKK